MGSHDLNHREEKHILENKILNRSAQRDRGRQWGWDLSARFYEWAYFYISHQLDQDMFDFLGVRVENAVVADCGCGPGVVAEKFLIRGAAKIFAIDASQEMQKRLRARFESRWGGLKVIPIQAPYNGNILNQIHKENMQGRGFDVVLFKRSLYLPRPQALEVLRQALPLLAPGGLIVVIHAEKNLWRYCFQTPWILARHSLHHIANRFISRF